MNLGILGVGGWGVNHVRTFSSLLGEESVTVVDPDPSRREAVRAAHPRVATIAESPPWEALDAVVIAAPAVLHHRLARQALRSGLHVLVEKPIALTSAEARELIELAEQRGCVLMVDHLLEYHPAIVRLKALIEQGELGRIYHMTSQRLNLGVIRTEENALWSLAPHDISIILYLLDREPVSVTAHGAAYLQPEIPDLAHLTMTFADGTLAHVHVSWLDPIRTRCLRVIGERAMAVFDDTAENKLVFHQKRAAYADGRYVPAPGEATVVPIGDTEPLRAVAETFLRSIETREQPRTDGHDGLRVVRILEAAQESMDTCGVPVRLERNP